jgi:hypothetical protein
MAKLEQEYKSVTPGPGSFSVITPLLRQSSYSLWMAVLKAALIGEIMHTQGDLGLSWFGFEGTMYFWTTELHFQRLTFLHQVTDWS